MRLLIIAILLATSNAAVAQWQSANYVISTSVFVSGITAEGQITGLPVNQKQHVYTYLDDQGRLRQTVIRQGSPGEKDVVSAHVYDEVGRKQITYLPVAHTTVDGSYKNGLLTNNGTYVGSYHHNFYNGGSPKVATDSKPYSQVVFDKSPLSRPVQVGTVGAAWQPNEITPASAKTVKYSYGSNLDGEVRRWVLKGIDPIVLTSYKYKPGHLSVLTTTDVNGFQSKEYKDLTGKTVATRVQVDATTWAETDYVFDERDRLILILPPLAVNALASQHVDPPLPTPPAGFQLITFIKNLTSYDSYSYLYTSNGSVTLKPNFAFVAGTTGASFEIRASTATDYHYNLTGVDQYIYQFRYDKFGRKVASKAPGSDWAYFVYNARDQVSLTQDGNQRVNNKWIFYKYDEYGRNIFSGIVTLTQTVEAIREAAANGPSYETVSWGPESRHFYSNTVFPVITSDDAYHTIHYYDSYQTNDTWDLLTSGWVAPRTFSWEQGAWNWNLYEANGLQVASKIRIVGENRWKHVAYFYDDDRRPVSEIMFIQKNSENGTYWDYSEPYAVGRSLDFSGRVLKSGIGYKGTVVENRFEYDHAGRVLKTFENVFPDGQYSSSTELVVLQTDYNEIGEVVKSNVYSSDHGASFLQGNDLRYNIQGALTTVNNLQGNPGETDYFGLELLYETQAPNAGNIPRHDGFISAIRWKDDLSARDNLYNFDYDAKGQMKSGIYKQNVGGAWVNEGKFSERDITYDLNGNIQGLTRYEGNAASAADQLAYTYTAGGNQIAKVADAAPTLTAEKGFVDGSNVANEYSYDVNGNLVSDLNKGLTIEYNDLNLQSRVSLSNGSYILYAYDAAGEKIAQTLYNESGVQTSRVEYHGTFILVDGEVQQVLTEYGRIVPPSYHNLVENKDAHSTSEYATTGSVTINSVFQNGETYVRAECNQSSGTPGLWPIGGAYAVKPGERYTFKVLGYRETSDNAYLYVKGNANDIIWTGTLLPQSNQNETWVSNDFVVPSGVTQITIGVRWNNPSNGATFLINRVALYKLNWEKEFFVADHLGNTRVVLNTNPSTIHINATFETEAVADETTKFHNINASHIVPHTLANATPDGNEVIRMNDTYRIGPARSLKVFPGDKIDASVQAYYDAVSGLTKTATTTMASALISVMTTGGVAEPVDGINSAYANSSNNITGFSLSLDQGANRPSAFLNFILFDESYVPLEASSVPVGSTAGVRHEVSLPQIAVNQLGYVFIYLSYDNESSNWVHFDEMKITHAESPVIQANGYYPYGMTSYSWTRDGETENKYKYQGKEYDDRTKFHDFHARQYDPLLGRFLSLDPKNQFASGYLGMGNSPMMGVDPDGRFWHIVIGAAIGGAINLGVKIAQGKVNFNNGVWNGIKDGGVAFGIGALAGGVAAATGGAAFTLAGGASAGAGGFVAGFGGGALGSAFSMPIQSAGNTAYFGDPPMTAGQYATGIVLGGVIGGGSNGLVAVAGGRGFWTGNLPSSAPSTTPSLQGLVLDEPDVRWEPKIDRKIDAKLPSRAELLDDPNPSSVRLNVKNDGLPVPYRQIDPYSSAGYKGKDILDKNHYFSKIVDNYMPEAAKFTIKGGDGVYRSLYQLPGKDHLGRSGIFEWIVEVGGNVTHRTFIPGGQVTGVPNKW